MNRDALLDSSFLVALLDATDVWHAKATSIAEALAAREIDSIVTDCVVNEVVSVLVRRAGEEGEKAADAIRTAQERFPPHEITYLYPEIRRLLGPVLSLMAVSDGRLSFHDALLALSAREMDVGLIVTFDQDFSRLDWLRVVASPDDLDQPSEVRESSMPAGVHASDTQLKRRRSAAAKHPAKRQ